ncbi:MAG: hypothetical protein PVH68_16690 [Armatimonadota bacterium]|jgi:ABC-type transport system involved in multi-copper enzyme maturation permease subunit
MLGLTNPVLTRELRTGLRGHRAFLLRTGFVAVLAVVVIVTWMTALGEMTGTWKGAALDLRAIPGLGRQLFAALGTALLVLLLALVPGYAAGAISGERETQTLDTLLCTWLKPRHIVLGKLGASTVFAVGLILSSLPAVSAVFLLGGVSPLEVGLLFLLLITASVFVGALSLFVSSRCTKTYMAVMVTYLLIGCLHYAGPAGTRVVFWCAEVAMPRRQIAEAARGAGAWQFPTPDLVSPVSASRSLFEGITVFPPISVSFVPQPPQPPTVLGAGGDRAERRQFVLLHLVSPAVMLLGSLVLVIATSRAVARSTHVVGPTLTQRLGRWLTQQARGSPPEAQAGDRAPRSAPRRAIRRRSSPWRRIADYVHNPVLARDLRGRPLGSADIITRASLYGFVLAEVIMLCGVGRFMDFQFVAKAMAVVVLVSAFLAAIPAAMCIAVEKEQRTLEMVVATLLRPRTIVWGKLAAAFWQAQPLVLLGLPVGVLSAAVDIIPWRSAAYMFILAEAFAFAACAIGVLVSLLARRPARAVSTTSCIVAGLAIGPILLLRLGISDFLGFGTPGRSLWVGPLGSLYHVFAWPTGAHALLAATVIGALAVALMAFAASLALFGRTVRRSMESS